MSRLARRSESSIPVTLWRGGRQGRATLQDMSPDGASATTPFPPGPKEAIRISRGQLTLDCQVVWARGKSFGFKFGHTLDDREWADLTS